MNQNQTPQANNCPAAAAQQSPSSKSSFEFSDRLIPLCDGRPGLRTTLQIQAHSTFSDQAPGASPLPVIDFVSSDATLDRYDEIISPVGWHLDNYRRNPVFQNAHQYGDIIFTLGKALVTEVRGGRLFQRIEFAVEANPMARIAYALYQGKFLNAVSVGFIPIRWANNDGTEFITENAKNAEIARKPSRFRRKYLEQELLEVSAVGIPANPNALQLGLKAGAVSKTDLQELREM